MGIKFWQRPEFKELEKHWHEKLKNTDFEDAEIEYNGKWVLKQNASNSYRQSKAVLREAKERYFDLLRYYFHQTTFLDPLEALVMERKASGRTIKSISEEVKAKYGRRCYRGTIRLIIQKYEISWGIK